MNNLTYKRVCDQGSSHFLSYGGANAPTWLRQGHFKAKGHCKKLQVTYFCIQNLPLQYIEWYIFLLLHRHQMCLSPSVYMIISQYLPVLFSENRDSLLQEKKFENWYYLMPEEGFSFFEIQPPSPGKFNRVLII